MFVKDEWTVGGRTLAQLFDRINATVGEHKRERKMRTLVVVDDLQSDIKRGKLGQSFENLVEVGRHDYATVFVLTQGMFKAGGAAFDDIRQSDCSSSRIGKSLLSVSLLRSSN